MCLVRAQQMLLRGQPMSRGARGRLSLTSLIDVIFLLLLFFMLSSTFSKFGTVDLNVGGGNARTDFNDTALVFARLSGAGVTINGRETALETVPEALDPLRRAGHLRLLLSVSQGTTAQNLVDALRVFNAVPNARFAILEPS